MRGQFLSGAKIAIRIGDISSDSIIFSAAMVERRKIKFKDGGFEDIICIVALRTAAVNFGYCKQGIGLGLSGKLNKDLEN